MTGLREKMKRRRREAALQAADKLFHERGYAQTTIDDIAKEAEVSIGTLYKYFGSKGGMIHELVKPVIEEMRAKGNLIIENPPAQAEEAIAAMYEAYRFNNDWKSLNLLKAFDPNFLGQDPHLLSIAEEFEEAFSEQMGKLLHKLVENSQLNPALNIEDAVFILYHHMYSHFQAHVSSDGKTSYEETLVNMHRRLQVIYESWAP